MDPDAIYIFLDMDGVIADFDKQARAQNLYLPDGESKGDGQHLDFAWWAHMPEMEGARKFYDDLAQLAKVRFLTGAKHNADCWSGKAQWILDFVSRENATQSLIVTGQKFEKWLLAGPARILVDDNKDVVDRWIKAGGVGVLHKGDFQETLENVRRAVEQIKEARKPAHIRLLDSFRQAVGWMWGGHRGPEPPQRHGPG